MPAKFKPKDAVTEGTVTVEIGSKSSKSVLKVTHGNNSVFLIDRDEAEVLADALDEALHRLESDPLLWP